MKLGENPKMPYPQRGTSIKTYARGNNDAPSISKYGSLVRPGAQIVALCVHCAECTPSMRGPWKGPARRVGGTGLWEGIEVPGQGTGTERGHVRQGA